jgi:hypothetical protein
LLFFAHFHPSSPSLSSLSSGKGQVYSFGAGEHGQLGIGEPKDRKEKEKELKESKSSSTKKDKEKDSTQLKEAWIFWVRSFVRLVPLLSSF